MAGSLRSERDPKKSETGNISYKSVQKKSAASQQRRNDIEVPPGLSIEGYARLLQDTTSESRRSEYTQQLQQTLGNTFVQRVLEYINTQKNGQKANDALSTSTTSVAAKPVLQRELSGISSEEEALNEPSTEVPALTERTVSAATNLIGEGREQEAINTIVDEIGAAQMPNLAYCVPPRPTFKPDLDLDGVCSFEYDPNTNMARRIWVDIGDSAFRSVSFLYSTIMHEYQHVNQAIEDPKGTKENTPMSEFAAYSWEIIHAWQTGMRNHSDDLKEIGNLLYDLGWSKMTEEEQEANLIAYRNAVGFVRGFTGDGTWEPS